MSESKRRCVMECMLDDADEPGVLLTEALKSRSPGWRGSRLSCLSPSLSSEFKLLSN